MSVSSAKELLAIRPRALVRSNQLITAFKLVYTGTVVVFGIVLASLHLVVCSGKEGKQWVAVNCSWWSSWCLVLDMMVSCVSTLVFLPQTCSVAAGSELVALA